MKAEVTASHGADASESALFVGRLIRQQGQYGSVEVVARVSGRQVVPLSDPKKVFSRNGLVEIHGLAHSPKLFVGEWIEFDVVKNTRPRGEEFKVLRYHRLARYATLAENSLERNRVLLTKEGWRGNARPGLWAIRISTDKVLVTELELGKDGALRIPRKSASEVHWWAYANDHVAHLSASGDNENIFLADSEYWAGNFDWSDEADHVAQVIRSLYDAKDPRLAELISWLELHHEAGTGRLVAAAFDHDAAEASLRSGHLAERLRADRDLMKAYLDAAVQDDAVREAVATYAREGHGIQASHLRAELDREIAEERARRIAEIDASLLSKREKEIEKVNSEIAKFAEEQRRKHKESELAVEKALSAKLAALHDAAFTRSESLNQEIVAQEEQLLAVESAVKTARVELERANRDTDASRERLIEIRMEIDRLLAVADRFSPSNFVAASQPAMTGGISYKFAEIPAIPAAEKGKLIAEHLLLNEQGKKSLSFFVALLLSGELPMLIGDGAGDFLKIAENLMCPGRAAIIEADPTMISIDDLWSRPGSGVPTMMAAAAHAAKAGAVLVVLRGIERSGARFWVPSLAEALRRGDLPRGLLVCCAVNDRDHEEIEALPEDIPWLNVSSALTSSAFLAGPSLLIQPELVLTTLDPGPLILDVTRASAVLANIGFKPTLCQAMRIVRIFTEASALFGDGEQTRHVMDQLKMTMS